MRNPPRSEGKPRPTHAPEPNPVQDNDRREPTYNTSSRHRAPAVIELLLAEGAGAVTALRVSEHAGVARSTIYQHWPAQNTLLLEAIDRIMTPHVPTSITNNLHDDVITALFNLRKRLAQQPFRALFATLLGHVNRDRTFVAAQRRFVTSVLQPIRDILTAAAQRGDLPSVVNVDEATAQLAGPLFIQHIMLRASISDDLITNTTRHFLASIQAAERIRHVEGVRFQTTVLPVRMAGYKSLRSQFPNSGIHATMAGSLARHARPPDQALTRAPAIPAPHREARPWLRCPRTVPSSGNGAAAP